MNETLSTTNQPLPPLPLAEMTEGVATHKTLANYRVAPPPSQRLNLIPSSFVFLSPSLSIWYSIFAVALRPLL